MQIITIDDQEFTQLLDAWRQGKLVGKYSSKGITQIVCATRQFMLVTSENNPEKIAIKPARSLTEAENLALQLLAREEERGNDVVLTEQGK